MPLTIFDNGLNIGDLEVRTKDFMGNPLYFRMWPEMTILGGSLKSKNINFNFILILFLIKKN